MNAAIYASRLNATPDAKTIARSMQKVKRSMMQEKQQTTNDGRQVIAFILKKQMPLQKQLKGTGGNYGKE